MLLIQNLEKQYGPKVLYRGANLSVHKGKRYGLIGHNGAGKSVFLRMVAGEESADNGNITISQGMKIGYLPQEAEENDGTISPMEILKEPFKELLNCEELFANFALMDHDSPEYEKKAEEISLLQTEIDKYEIYSLESRASSILSGLGVAQENFDKPISELSGGYRMRVLLAKLLLLKPDFLLLDEPTNHLDMDSLIWLERFLQRFTGGMIIVSHDRDFLDRIITDTVEVQGGKLTQYSGNLSSFFAWKEMNEESEEKRLKNLTEKINQTEQFIERFKSKASKATQARSKMKHLEKLKEELPEEKTFRKNFNFSLPPATPCGAVPIKIEKVTAGYDNKTVLSEISTTITKGDKVAIIGPNGAGKSTFLKVCAGVLEPMTGTKIIGHNTDIRFFSQHRLDELNGDMTLYDTVVSVLGENRPTEVMKLLGSFLFSGDEVEKKVSVLSGGEKSRLSLLLMLVHPGNTILLDEPTNHLDIESIEEVSQALHDYDGTIVMVSHDEYFLKRIATRIIEIRPGSFRDFPGSIDTYREYIEKGFMSDTSENEETAVIEKSDQQLSKEARMAQRESRKKITRRIEKLEREIEVQEEKIEEQNTVLHDPENAMDHNLLIETQNKISALEETLSEIMEEWESLQLELEELDA